MGLHRDDTNMEFDPMERNTRRQVWYAIYTFERTLCSILGRPTIIDDSEIMMRVPDASMLEQRCPSAEYMGCASQMIKLSYSMRQRAYFDPITAEERSPTVTVASTLLRECNEFFSSIPRHLSVDQSSTAPDQKARILLLHIYYYYMRCIVSRDFLIAKVEKNICHLENRAPPALEDWEMTLALSEDCVESAYRSIQYMMDASDLGVIGAALDLFFVFHSVLIVCADFLARPRQQHDSPKDIDKKAAVRATLNHIRGLKQLAPTYSILSRIAMQFATMTGVCDKPLVQGQPIDPSLEPQLTPEDDAFRFTDVEDDWFASATTNLGLDFFDLNEAAAGYPTPGTTTDSAYTGYLNPNASEVDEWTARTLRGMYSM
jgi:proline utilization trans-activator